MKEHIVVSLQRHGYSWPRLVVTVEARVSSATAAERFVIDEVLKAYAKRTGRTRVTCKVKDMRVVDELGLKRLLAAAKASVTIRRKRAAKKGILTRARNAAMKGR